MIFSSYRSISITTIQILVCVTAFYMGGIIALEFHVPLTNWNPSDAFGWQAYKLFALTIYGISLFIMNLILGELKSTRTFCIIYSISSLLLIILNLHSWEIMPHRTLLLIFSGLVGIWSIFAIQWILNYLFKRNQNDQDLPNLNQTQGIS